MALGPRPPGTAGGRRRHLCPTGGQALASSPSLSSSGSPQGVVPLGEVSGTLHSTSAGGGSKLELPVARRVSHGTGGPTPCKGRQLLRHRDDLVYSRSYQGLFCSERATATWAWGHLRTFAGTRGRVRRMPAAATCRARSLAGPQVRPNRSRRCSGSSPMVLSRSRPRTGARPIGEGGAKISCEAAGLGRDLEADQLLVQVMPEGGCVPRQDLTGHAEGASESLHLLVITLHVIRAEGSDEALVCDEGRVHQGGVDPKQELVVESRVGPAAAAPGHSTVDASDAVSSFERLLRVAERHGEHGVQRAPQP